MTAARPRPVRPAMPRTPDDRRLFHGRDDAPRSGLSSFMPYSARFSRPRNSAKAPGLAWPSPTAWFRPTRDGSKSRPKSVKELLHRVPALERADDLRRRGDHGPTAERAVVTFTASRLQSQPVHAWRSRVERRVERRLVRAYLFLTAAPRNPDHSRFKADRGPRDTALDRC